MSYTKHRRNKFSRKRLTLSLLGLVSFCAGLGTSITATYAWYSLTRIADVGNLNIYFNCDDAYLQLGRKNEEGEIVYPDASSYNVDDLKEDEEEKVLGEVSGMFASTWKEGFLNADTLVPKFRSSYRGKASYKDPGLADEKAYIQSEFYLKCNYGASIYLTPESYLRANKERNKETAAKYPEEHLVAEKLDKGVNATRVSFMSINNENKVDYTIICNEERNTLYGGLLDLYGDHYYDTLNGKEILFGEYDTKEDDFVYKDNPSLGSQEEIKEDEFSTFTAYHQDKDSSDNVIQGIDFDSFDPKIKEENAVPINKLILPEGQGSMGIAPIATLKPNEDKRIVVSIYVEGWDKDMIDSIGRASIDINIGFVALLDR